jgi:hypothetical protein
MSLFTCDTCGVQHKSEDYTDVNAANQFLLESLQDGNCPANDCEGKVTETVDVSVAVNLPSMGGGVW